MRLEVATVHEEKNRGIRNKLAIVLVCLAVIMLILPLFHIRIYVIGLLNLEWSAIFFLIAACVWSTAWRSYARKLKVVAVILTSMGLCLILLTHWMGLRVGTFRTFQDPVTNRQFAMEMRRTHPLRTRGYAVYYERIEPLLLFPQATEHSNSILWGDWPSVSISESGIHVNYTWMSGGATFPLRGELDGLLQSFDELVLRRSVQERAEHREITSIHITENTITYTYALSASEWERWLEADWEAERRVIEMQGERYETVLISAEQYQEIRKMLEEAPFMSLARSVYPRYYISVPRSIGETSISLQVDGAEVFQALLEFRQS